MTPHMSSLVLHTLWEFRNRYRMNKQSLMTFRNALLCTFLFVLVSGCVAQQADVIRMKRDLDAKIAVQEKNRIELQAAVKEAHEALEQANQTIEQQDAQIQSLVRARAETVDQMTNLRDRDLSDIHGKVEQNDHAIHALSGQLDDLSQEWVDLQTQVNKHEKTAEAASQKFNHDIDQNRQVLATQAKENSEFRASLVEFKDVLGTLRDQLRKQEVHLQNSDRKMDGISQQTSSHSGKTSTYLKDVDQSITSLMKALETVNKSLTERLNEQDQRYAKSLHQLRTKLVSQAVLNQQQESIRHLTQRQERLQKALDLVVETLGEKVDAHEVQLSSLTHQPSLRKPVSLQRANLPERPKVPISAENDSASHVVPKVTVKEDDVAYQGAHQKLKNGQVQEALKEFSTFLVRHPNSPLAGNAQYWMGECYYVTRQFNHAIGEFERVLKLYSDSEKVPAALLKIGYSHLELKDAPKAKGTFRQLVRLYPRSPEAAKAYARLTEVDTTHQQSS